MMYFYVNQDGSIRVECYRWGLLREVTVGNLRQGGEDEDYWHFYPTEECVLSAGSCRRIMEKLAELNESIGSQEMLIGDKKR